MVHTVLESSQLAPFGPVLRVRSRSDFSNMECHRNVMQNMIILQQHISMKGPRVSPRTRRRRPPRSSQLHLDQVRRPQAARRGSGPPSGQQEALAGGNLISLMRVYSSPSWPASP